MATALSSRHADAFALTTLKSISETDIFKTRNLNLCRGVHIMIYLMDDRA